MQLHNDNRRFGLIALILHWGVFVLFVAQYLLYQLMHNWPVSDLKWAFYDLHKSIGISLFFIALFRIFWRIANPMPAPPLGQSPWQRRAARFSHFGLYAAMFVMPVSGYIGSKAGGFSASWFGFVHLPDLFGKSDSLNYWAELVHTTTSYFALAVVSVHAGAACWHHFYRGDDVLVRMWPPAQRSRRAVFRDEAV